MIELSTKQTLEISGGNPLILGAIVGGFMIDAFHGGVCLNATHAVINTFKSGFDYLFSSTKKPEPVITVTPVGTITTPTGIVIK